MSVTGGSSDQGPSSGPFSLLASDYRKAMNLLEVFLDFLDEPGIGLQDIAKEIQSLPPEQRFTDSFEVYFKLFGISDPEEADVGDLPGDFENVLADSDKRSTLLRLLQLIDQEAAKLEQESFDRLLSDRDQDLDFLLFAVYLLKLRDILGTLESRIRNEAEADDTTQLLSELAALHSHFILIALGEKSEFDESILRDTLRYDFYDRMRQGRDPKQDPDELERDEVVAELGRQGAVAAYDRLSISVSRGAELGGIHRKEFEKLLVEHGIQPRYGPSSGDDLRRGPGLSKSG